MTGAPPAVDRRILEGLLADWLPRARGRRLLLAYGRYVGTEPEFVLPGPRRRRVHVTDQPSVLGILAAWQEHEAAHTGDDDLLVVTTGVTEEQLGWDIRGYAIGRAVRTVDRARVVAQRFGAADVDPRIRDKRESWLVDALLEAEPPGGWTPAGAVLTRDAAVGALIGARLGPEYSGGVLDAGALLEWSREPGGAARFAALPAAERDGIAEWLAGTAGEVARLVLRLAAEGRAGDAVPLGVLGTAAASSRQAALAFGGLLPGVDTEALRGLTDAAAGILERWVAQAESGGQGEAASERAWQVLRRADELATRAGLTQALSGNRFLPAEFEARLGALATALEAESLPEAERELAGVGGHALAQLAPARHHAAAAAVRLLAWLATPHGEAGSVAAAVRAQIQDTAWADRALAALWAGDPDAEPAVGRAYRRVCEAVRTRRDGMDGAFAKQLASWAAHASATEPAGCLLVERVQQHLAAPLRAPLVIVADGMSAAVATELGEAITRQAFTEASPTAGERAAAVAVLPSVTRASRASLLTGQVTTGEQATEKDGFAAFWRRRRKQATLFHKGELTGKAGQRLADELVGALAADGVVGVVLNTIDDALDHGREGARTGWRPNDVTHLPELLAAARDYGRPVMLTSDHGHVPERGEADGPRAGAPGRRATARWPWPARAWSTGTARSSCRGGRASATPRASTATTAAPRSPR